MTSVPAVLSVPLGNQRPRLESLPPADDWSQGEDAVELARQAGLVLDDWQQYVLLNALAMCGSRWAAFEVCLIVSRQNGKGSVIEALELAALFLFDDVRLILHSAHKFDTAADAFRRILGLIEQSPDFSREVAKVIRSHGSESIELRNGKRLRFIARSAGAGRGFAADLVILDEAFNISEDAMASMLPTLSTRPNPQVWYTSTAGGPTSVQLGRVRGRGLVGGDPSLAFFEWSVDADAYDPADPRDWALGNPGMGVRISPEYIALERASLTAEAFATERLGVGLYPTDLADAWLVVPKDVWGGLADPGSMVRDPVALGVEMTLVAPRKQPWVSIAAAGQRADGRFGVEVVDRRLGSDWVASRLVALRKKHKPCAVIVDPAGHAGALIEGLVQAGVDVAESFAARDAAQAFGHFRDLVTTGRLRHRGDDRLDRSLAGATTRPLADAEAWDRRDPRVDLGPVVAASLACWGFRRFGLGRVAPYDVLRSVG
jgi:hypothetical protein